MNQHKTYWELTLSMSHQKKSFKRIKKLTTSEYLEKLMMTPTVMKGETMRFDNLKLILQLSK